MEASQCFELLFDLFSHFFSNDAMGACGVGASMIDGMIDLLAIFADVQSISLQRDEVYELLTNICGRLGV